MDAAKVQELFQRVARLQTLTGETAGNGCRWEHKWPDGMVTVYHLPLVKPPESIQDALLNAYVAAWSMKDYLAKRAKALGASPRDIEDFVNANSALQLCADVANDYKHGGWDRPTRTARRPKFGDVTYTMPKAAIRSISFFQHEGKDHVAVLPRPDRVQVRLPIVDETTRDVLGDAFDILDTAVGLWERRSAELENSLATPSE